MVKIPLSLCFPSVKIISWGFPGLEKDGGEIQQFYTIPRKSVALPARILQEPFEHLIYVKFGKKVLWEHDLTFLGRMKLASMIFVL